MSRRAQTESAALFWQFCQGWIDPDGIYTEGIGSDKTLQHLMRFVGMRWGSRQPKVSMVHGGPPAVRFPCPVA